MGRQLHYSNWRRRVLAPAAGAIERPEINGKTHVLRHTTGALVERGATTHVAQAMMRHKKYSTAFEVYGHMDSGINDLATEAVDRQVAAGAPTMRPPEEAEVIVLRPAT
jgi:site-specific recombinase XerD